MQTVATICEILMIGCFGASWPFNIIRAYKARTTKGTSLPFLFLIFFGYVAGITCKICSAIAKGAGFWNFLQILAFTFYVVNLSMLTIALIIYARNSKLDKERK